MFVSCCRICCCFVVLLLCGMLVEGCGINASLDASSNAEPDANVTPKSDDGSRAPDVIDPREDLRTDPLSSNSQTLEESLENGSENSLKGGDDTDTDADLNARSDSDAEAVAEKREPEIPNESQDVDDAADDDVVDNPDVETKERLTDEEVLKGFPEEEVQRSLLCKKGRKDKFALAYCRDEAPLISSLKDLQKLVGLSFTNLRNRGRANNGLGGNPSFALLSHSASLVGRGTTSLVPRAIIFSPANNANVSDPDFVAMGFLRGHQTVELIARDPSTKTLSFYLVTFKQECNRRKDGCNFGELLSPSIESNWKSVSVYDDEDLKNTILDCRQCHQPNGPDSAKQLRMHELEFPWTHFFRDNTDEGKAVMAEFFTAHKSDEAYAGIPASHISSSDPFDLENLIKANGFRAANIVYDAPRIASEVNASSPAQPANNSKPGVSATWLSTYELARKGRIPSIPYHDAKTSDSEKVSKLAAEYKKLMANKLNPADLPDIRDTFKEDRNIGFQVKEGSSGEEILRQACSQCHHSRLDQTISRARFNVDRLGSMSRAAKDLAIARLRLKPHDLKAMPPRLFKDLTDEERQRAIEFLQQ